MSVESGLGRVTRDAIAAASVSRITLGLESSLHPPIIHRLVRREEDEVQTLEDVPLLNLPPEEEGHCVVEGDKRLLEHELVAGRERADNVKVQVGGRAREDEVWREGVDVA